MITVRFEKTETQDKFHRKAIFPNKLSFQEELSISSDLYLIHARYQWEQSTYQLPEKALVDMGKCLALAALGKEGVKQFIKQKREGSWLGITFIESPQTPEVAAIPWELIHIDGEFLSLNFRTPVRRMIDGYCRVENLLLNKPLKMALLSATPSDLDKLLIEREQLRFARSIGHLISKNHLTVHEIMNCTREKLASALRYNNYDIIYFTGHGTYARGTGYLCLEDPDGKREMIDSLEFARLTSGSLPRLVFLNCCQSGASDARKASDTFRDVARKLIETGVPDIIATLTTVFDEHAQIFMKTFFDEIFSEYNVSNAITRARDDLKNKLKDTAIPNTFYQFVHLTQTLPNPGVAYKESVLPSSKGNQYYASPFHPSVDMNFVRRYNAVTQVEASYREGNKAVLVYGMGGVGKTALSAMLEQILLEHYDPSLGVKDTLWLDLRSICTTGAMIDQLSSMIADKGNALNSERIKKLEKPLEVSKILNETFGSEIFLTIDNCETLLDAESRPKDMEMFQFLISLVAHTIGWKIFLTSREPFDLELDTRTLFNYTKYHLGSLAFTERVALLDTLLISNKKTLHEDLHDNVLREVGGNPYELHLFVKNLSQAQDVDTLIRETHTKTGEYAYLDYYVGKITEDALRVLHILATFQSPPSEHEIGEVLKGYEHIDTKKCLADILNIGLIEQHENQYYVPPILAFYLTERSGKYCMKKEDFNTYSHTITVLYHDLYYKGGEKLSQTLAKGSRDKREGLGHLVFLIKGLRQSFFQSDVELQVDLLTTLADKAPGILPVREVLDYASKARENINTIAEKPELKKQVGALFHNIGFVFQNFRQWENALENYSKAVKWKEDTKQYHALGNTYHQIGRVYEEQRQWENALENYLVSLQHFMKYAQENPDIGIVICSIQRLYKDMVNAGVNIPLEIKEIIDNLG